MTQWLGMNESARRRFADLAECFARPCIVDAPLLAQELMGRNVSVAGFTDASEFTELPGFRTWSIASPVYVEDEFDFVFVATDENLRGSQLFSALRVLCHFDFETPVVVVSPGDVASRLATSLERFGVVAREPVDELAVLSNFELP